MDLNWRDLHNRVVKNFKTEIQELAGGRCLLVVSTLGGVVMERIEAPNKQEAEREMAALGYERVPPSIVVEIDQVARERHGHPKANREIQ